MQRPGLPGEDLIAQGLRDLRLGLETDSALVVSIGAPRLARLGVDVPRPLPDAEHRLYARLARAAGAAAHARYNALLRRLVSYERAWSCAR